MADQPSLFPPEPPKPWHTGPTPVSRREDPPTSHAAEHLLNASGRRTTQKARIRERLETGPATNAELAAICLKYTGRISDLRHDGYEITCERQEASGLVLYRLGAPQNAPTARSAPNPTGDPSDPESPARGLTEPHTP